MIFQSELTSLETELSQLELMLTAKRQQLGFFQNLQSQADECLERLSRVVNHAKESTAHGAIASLKTAVLTLFADGDSGTDYNGGNQPNDPTPDTDPTPGADDDEPDLIAFNGETGDYLLSDGSTSVEDDLPLTYAQAIKKRATSCFGYEITSKTDLKHAFINRCHITPMEGVWLDQQGQDFYKHCESILDKYFYNGQSCDWASPLASPLACQTWEDAPLTGQHCTITLSTTEDNKNNSTNEGEDMPKPPSTEMVHLSANCGYLKLKADGRILAAYCWFSRKNIAESWMQQIEVIPTASVEMRESQRNTSWKWELKITGLSMTQVERLSQEALHQKPAKSNESPAIAAGIEPPSGWGKPQVKQELPPCPFATGDIVDWKGCILRVAAVGVETLHCVLQSDLDGTRPHTKVPIAECVLVEEGLDVGDKVEILSDRYLGAKGKEVVVNAVLMTAELPIGVELPNGNTRYFPRTELKFIAYKPSQQQQQPYCLQAGTVLMGKRIVTTGSYTGLARRNAINNFRTGLADKLAAIELMKSGLSTEEAQAAVSGTDPLDIEF